ncbi:hypothetical protein EXIGLDRAFT_778303 [Exidia glandulosa HHB12029]|uniref:DRBM domain-containing protein n=1 Tax=Exidia glandulosa HHB12029 TaxID=1314781 RepID=A0A165CL07_EXIGL|nr:hypothetical protein EXIGLDRAFT_778303 [Exidia glandulosa HHB12029]
MADILRTDTARQRTLPNEYSGLLQFVCGRHALWAPRKVSKGGGALGDAGYISGGSFYKEFNVYENPPKGIPPLPRPISGIVEDDQFHMPLMQSSHNCSVELCVTGTTEIAAIPLTVPPLSIEPRIVLQTARFAFLAPPAPIRKDTLTTARRAELCEWLTKHRHDLQEGTIIITEVVRSSGWVGGVATGKRTQTAATVGAGGASVSASAAYTTSLMAPVRGPDNWSPLDDAGYTLIVNYVAARTRLQRLVLKAKAALSTSASRGRASEDVASEHHTASSTLRQESSNSEHVTAEGEGLDQAPLDEDEGGDPEGHDSNLLTRVLDKILDENYLVDVAVGDWSCVTNLFAASTLNNQSSSTRIDHAQISATFDKRTVVSGSGSETVAYIDHLTLQTQELERPSLVSIARQRAIKPPPQRYSQAASESPGLGGNGVLLLNNELQRQGKHGVVRWVDRMDGSHSSPSWTSRVYIEEVEYAIGYGPTKQAARDHAAALALAAL